MKYNSEETKGLKAIIIVATIIIIFFVVFTNWNAIW
jgi:hypothetical protein